MDKPVLDIQLDFLREAGFAVVINHIEQQQAEIDELEKDKVDLASQLKSLIDALTWSNKMLLDITDQHIKVKKTIEENTELISEMNASSMDRIFSNAEIKLKGIKQPK
jgi:peptidoglycan hydrolase CwlO-like protein